MSFHVPNQYRLREGPLQTTDAAGNNGAFAVYLAHGQRVAVIASDGGLTDGPWEHVSVSRRDRCPLWDEMCQVKSLFWDAEDCVVQYHPPASRYVNAHPFCLHLWRRPGYAFPLPPSLLVG
jgi:hypothetical protein